MGKLAFSALFMFYLIYWGVHFWMLNIRNYFLISILILLALFISITFFFICYYRSLKFNQYLKLSDYIHRKNVQKIEIWVLNIHFNSYYLLQKNREIIRYLIDESFTYFDDWSKVPWSDISDIFHTSKYLLFV